MSLLAAYYRLREIYPLNIVPRNGFREQHHRPLRFLPAHCGRLRNETLPALPVVGLLALRSGALPLLQERFMSRRYFFFLPQAPPPGVSMRTTEPAGA